MEDKTNVQISEQSIEAIKSKMMVGDYITASQMLGITTDNVRVRLNRGKQDVYDCLCAIVENRAELVQNYKTA